MGKVYYVGYYTSDNAGNRKSNNLAAINKMDYICQALNSAGYNVEIVSLCGAMQKSKGGLYALGKNADLRYFSSLAQHTRSIRFLNRIWIRLQLLLYMVVRVKKEDRVIVYHSLGYYRTIALLKKLCRKKVVLEVEEIYSDVTGNHAMREKEMRFFRCADGYIFPTELLNGLVNTKSKPATIVYGSYQMIDVQKCSFENDILHEKKHLIYAGTFDPRKGGAIAAAAAAEHLPSDYHIHILGFGSEADKKLLQDEVNKIAKLDCATVTMDGLLSGEEYIRFVQSCDVGFSTQMPDAAFNNTSFPSKVLSYLANGLRVVSVRIPALEHSEINDLLYYYDGNDPKKIAEAVMSIDWGKAYDSRKVISRLNEEFVKKIGELLK